MAWFGEPWPSVDERAQVCEDDAERVLTPIGKACVLCEEEIAAGDRGTLYGSGEPCHAECGLREVIGGAGHLVAEVHDPGSCDPDGGLSRRRSALLVWKWIDEMGIENLLGASRFPQMRESMQLELEEWREGRPG